MKRFLLNALGTATVLLLGACGTPGPSPQGQAGQDRGLSADHPLLEVWVPGSIRTYYDHPDKRLNPMLNPKTPAPAFKEDEAMASQCAPSSLSADVTDGAAPMVDRAAFERVMRQGRDTAQARQLWDFNLARLQAQQKVVIGPRTQRGNEPVQPRPTGRAGDPPPSPARNLPAPRNPFSEQQQQLQYNQEVLIAQDERLRAQSQQYARALAGLYGDAFGRFANAAPERLPLARLNAFEVFRAQQVELCIAMRGDPDAATQAQLQQINARYLPVAQGVIAASRAQVLQALNAAPSSRAFQQAWNQQFPTPWLRDVAGKDVELARAATARSQTLMAQEARARAEAERRAAAEVARQAAALRKKYLDKAARNEPPTVQEVTVLATTYLMNNSATYTGPGKLGPLERTGDGSFNDYRDFPIFGRLLTGETTVAVDGLRCQPRGKRQVCAMRIATASAMNDLLLGMRPNYRGTSDEEVEFQWAAEGLESAPLKKSMGTIYLSSSRSSGSASSAPSRRDGADRDEFNNNLEQFKETRRSEAATAGHWYMGESPQNLQRQYGR